MCGEAEISSYRATTSAVLAPPPRSPKPQVLIQSSDSPTTRIKLLDNTIEPGGQYAILLNSIAAADPLTRVQVRGNIMAAAGTTGTDIRVAGAKDCQIIDNDGEGDIYLDPASARIKVSGNRADEVRYAGTDHLIQGNDVNGVLLTATSVMNVNNQVRDNQRLGKPAVFVRVSTAPTMDLDVGDDYSMAPPTAVTITGFAVRNCVNPGRTIRIHHANGNVTWSHNPARLKLAGSVSWNPPGDSVLVLQMLEPGIWHEISRKLAGPAAPPATTSSTTTPSTTTAPSATAEASTTTEAAPTAPPDPDRREPYHPASSSATRASTRRNGQTESAVHQSGVIRIPGTRSISEPPFNRAITCRAPFGCNFRIVPSSGPSGTSLATMSRPPTTRRAVNERNARRKSLGEKYDSFKILAARTTSKRSELVGVSKRFSSAMAM